VPSAIFWESFLNELLRLLPWFLLAGGMLCALSLTPLGRALTRFLQERHLPIEANAQRHQELESVRRELSEIHERLDFAERLLARLSPADTSSLHPLAGLPEPLDPQRHQTPV